jgi:transcriptional regulator with XRE-family HTH domain
LLATETKTGFGAIIKHNRENHQLTQERLAELIEVDTRTIQRWEAETCIPWPLYIEKVLSIMPEIETPLRAAIKKNTEQISDYTLIESDMMLNDMKSVSSYR